MHSRFLAMTILPLLLAGPAIGGELSFSEGKVTWQSTQCPVPAIPAFPEAVNSETAANDMNWRVMQYNQYVLLAQAYMDCVSNESQRDAKATGQVIVNAGQTTIADTQNTVTQLSLAAQKRK